jgi:hypothetical protein
MTETNSTLSTEDRRTLFAILEDRGFRAAMAGGFACPTPPLDIRETLRLSTASGEQSQEITGCAVSREASTAKTLYDLLSRY